MLGKYFKKMFGGGDKEVPANEQFYSPLRIALHSTVDINMVDWLVAISELNKSMKLPKGRLSVVAIGTTDADPSIINDFYMIDEANEEFTLQVVCSANIRSGDVEVNETSLYREVRNITPLTSEEWDKEMADVGENVMELDDNKYDRVWASGHDGKIDLLEFEETIVLTDRNEKYTNNYVLYSRELDVPWAVPDEKPTEFLLVGVEETEDTAELVTRIGINIPRTTIKVQ